MHPSFEIFRVISHQFHLSHFWEEPFPVDYSRREIETAQIDMTDSCTLL